METPHPTSDASLPAKTARNWNNIALGAGIIAVACISIMAGWVGSYLIFDKISPINEQVLALPKVSQPNQVEWSSATQLLTIVEDWEISFDEDFSHGVHGWDTGTYSGRLVSSFAEFHNGYYRIEAVAHEGFVSWELPGETAGLDFYLEVTGRVADGSHGQYGLVFHFGENGYYMFVIDPIHKTFEINMRKDNAWQTIQDDYLPEPVSRVWNKVAVLAVEGVFYFLVNDSIIYSTQDHSLPPGDLGLIYSLDYPRAFAIFEFDEFILRQPQK